DVEGLTTRQIPHNCFRCQNFNHHRFCLQLLPTHTHSRAHTTPRIRPSCIVLQPLQATYIAATRFAYRLFSRTPPKGSWSTLDPLGSWPRPRHRQLSQRVPCSP